MEKLILLTCRSMGSSPSIRMLSLLLGFFISSSLLAQSNVKGKVTGEDGLGLPGVNVLVKGTTQGTVTDADGNYSMNLPSQGEEIVLMFSFIGYVSQEQSLQGRTVIDVKLVSDIKELGEVIVVGYGTQVK